MKIVIPVLGFSRSGGQRVLSFLATNLIKLGHDVYFVVPESSMDQYYKSLAKIVKCREAKTKYKVINMAYLLYSMNKKCREISPDVIVANYHITAFVALFTSSRIKKKYYIQANEANFSKSIIKKTLAYLTYILPMDKIVNSEFLLPNFLNNYIAIVPAGLDIPLYISAREKKSRKSCTKINIGIIGRKEFYKGTREAIEAISRFIKKYNLDDEIMLNVAIYLPENMSDLVKNTSFFNINSDIELADFYAANDIFVATGLLEDGAFHYPCAESMASGCFVISNYAPLAMTSSNLKMEFFSHDTLVMKLKSAYDLLKEGDTNEIISNRLAISNLSWDIVSKDFENALLQ